MAKYLETDTFDLRLPFYCNLYNRALMGDKIAKICHEELERRPCKNAVETLQKTLAIHTQYWPVLARLKFKMSHFFSGARVPF